jgi:hypothetical protein
MSNFLLRSFKFSTLEGGGGGDVGNFGGKFPLTLSVSSLLLLLLGSGLSDSVL